MQGKNNNTLTSLDQLGGVVVAVIAWARIRKGRFCYWLIILLSPSNLGLAAKDSYNLSHHYTTGVLVMLNFVTMRLLLLLFFTFGLHILETFVSKVN